MTAPKKQHNKQHDARAASFRRIAKAVRKEAKDSIFFTNHRLAQIFDAEATLLRSMR
ncbi:MAG: hypothetical protein H0X36_15460 [Sphingomonadaceae bacterium]|nr:hypothetical protein [Sphingomonadaceae bacterium]